MPDGVSLAIPKTTRESRTKPVAESIESRADYLLPGSMASDSVPSWPADVFCICAAILQSSGAYSRVLNDKDSKLRRENSNQRSSRLRKIGSSWKVAFGSRRTPKVIKQLWSTVFAARKTLLSELGSNDSTSTRNALLDLLAIADEACVGLGILNVKSTSKRNITLKFDQEAEKIVVNNMTAAGASLCKEIHPSRARVLPKIHTPQSGLTIRSLSHHLGYCPGSEMLPFWHSVPPTHATHNFNLLVIPWPPSIDPSQFSATKTKGVSEEARQGGYGLFTFELRGGPPIEYVRALRDDATARVGRIDGIVFPELAMSEDEFDAIARDFSSPTCFVVSGVGQPADAPAPGVNKAILDTVDADLSRVFGDTMHIRITQTKHHRWKLEKNQIVQYGLGSNLHPLANWWEHIELGDRRISFITIQPWLTMSVLICEDLARPDPVGDVIRAVGPNLIIALLSDGPQIGSRWPGRYASGFADDPGSSVMTVTSRGMSKLSKATDPSKNRSETVVLWRDARSGTHEIACPEGYDGIVLNVTAEYHEEWTADGRRDGKNSSYPVLSGYHLIKRPKPTERGNDDNDIGSRRSDPVSSFQTIQRERASSVDQPSRQPGRKGFGTQSESRDGSIQRKTQKSKARLTAKSQK